MMSIQQAQAIVDDIWTLHTFCISADAIARKLHLSERIVRHAIEHGQLPVDQPQWKQPSDHIEA